MTALADPVRPFDLASTPLRIGLVRLHVRDLARTADFYRKIVGLEMIERGTDRLVLGTGRHDLIELRGDPWLEPRNPAEAGLYHTAFLLPSRADLGRWVAFARDAGIRLDGAADHAVSEAVYLADPEGNGIEIYADRPPGDWPRQDGRYVLANNRLDQAALIAASPGRWSGAPDRTVIGHVHLQVGDVAVAERFYHETLGFDVTCRFAKAAFFGGGGYHHQLAGNVWHSAGAGRREPGRTGLAAVELIASHKAGFDALKASLRDATLSQADGRETLTLEDPWGTRLELRH